MGPKVSRLRRETRQSLDLESEKKLVGAHSAPASFNNAGSSALRACKSELPPICMRLMKILGTVRWLVKSTRASWIAGPSSKIHI